MMHFLRMGCLLVLFLSLPVLVGASPFALSGEWKLNANGWMYKLVLLEKGDHLDGMLRPINHQAPDTPLNGRVLGDGRVEFACELGGSSQSRFASPCEPCDQPAARTICARRRRTSAREYMR